MTSIDRTTTPPDLTAAAAETLRETFGHTALRPGQAEAIRHTREGRDVLVVLPTGGGKSLCYQLPAVCDGGLTVVVSPLIALMDDQVGQLRARGVPAAALHGLRDAGAAAATLRDAARGRLRLLYLSPERLAAPALRRALAALPPARVVVDEAHCVVRWGHDFRPDYLGLKDALRALGDPPLTAVTATATREMQREILAALGRPRARRVVTGFDRPELFFAVRLTPSRRSKQHVLRTVLARTAGPTLVYTGTRAGAEAVARELSVRHNISAAAYHAGLSGAARRAVQRAFDDNRLRVVAATSAFGMGVDKPDVRGVVHWTLPFDLTGYYQSAGRAGRDGAPALCVMCVAEEDVRLRRWQIAAAAPGADELRALYRALAGAEDGCAADKETLADAADVPTARVQSGLAALARCGIARRVGGWGGAWLLVRPPRDDELPQVAAEAAARADARRAALAEVVRYAQGTRCRRAALLAHLGDRPTPDRRPPPARCCDYCRAGSDAVAAGRPGPPNGRANSVASGEEGPRPGYGRAHPVASGEARSGPRSGRLAPATEDAVTPPAEAGTQEAGRVSADVAAAAEPGDDLDQRVLRAVGADNGRLTTRTLAAALRETDGPAPRLATVRAAVARLIERRWVVVFHGHGPARLALTSRGEAQLAPSDRVAERRASYDAVRANPSAVRYPVGPTAPCDNRPIVVTRARATGRQLGHVRIATGPALESSPVVE